MFNLPLFEFMRRAVHICRPRRKLEVSSLEAVHLKFQSKTSSPSIAVDLGCGPNPRNLFGAEFVYGVDMFADGMPGIKKCHLGFEPLPFSDEYADYLTAYDVLEHIPRYSDRCAPTYSPFIDLMNECWRILKPGGCFLSLTPIYPYSAAFQDPTHNNIMTVNTFKLYFSEDKYDIARHYGIETNFKILYEKIYGEHLLAILSK